MTTTANMLFVLGASDPEMQAIESLLSQAGVAYAYAVGPDGQRVHPGNAYRAVGAVTPDGKAVNLASISHTVECAIDGVFGPVVIDHHRPGDPGYGKPPAEFFSASSLGQVLKHLHQSGYRPLGDKQTVIRVRADRKYILADCMMGFCDPPTSWNGGCADPGHCAQHPGTTPDGAPMVGVVLTVSGQEAHRRIVRRLQVAAADHCLAAAYWGQCPGVDPDTLMKWRAKSRAEFQGRDVNDVLDDIEAARTVLRESRTEAGYADLRGQNVPELPEAAAREGIPFVATVRERDGREKVVLQAASPQLVQRFLAGDLIPGLVGHYGDPARGFAGGYIS